MKTTLIAAAVLALAVTAGVAYAQSNVAAAIGSGAVGEQADGYLGVRGSVSAGVRAEVESINIKRRAAYTDRAAQRGVTVKDVGAAVGCETLANRVGQGEAYQVGGTWRVRQGAVALPDYCAG